MTKEEVFRRARLCINRFEQLSPEEGITMALEYVWAQAQMQKTIEYIDKDIERTTNA
jgi:hypothetical protein